MNPMRIPNVAIQEYANFNISISFIYEYLLVYKYKSFYSQMNNIMKNRKRKHKIMNNPKSVYNNK